MKQLRVNTLLIGILVMVVEAAVSVSDSFPYSGSWPVVRIQIHCDWPVCPAVMLSAAPLLLNVTANKHSAKFNQAVLAVVLFVPEWGKDQ